MWYILLLIILCIWYCQYEPFQDLKIYTMKLYGSPKYIRLNKFNRVETVGVKPPLPKTGESGCNKVTCPPWVPDNSTCYRCE